jgi:hypothetical protein
VHGGITFGGLREMAKLAPPAPPWAQGLPWLRRRYERREAARLLSGKPSFLWWIGFDCSHARDLLPVEMDRTSAETYRDLAFVRAEVQALARQLGEPRQILITCARLQISRLDHWLKKHALPPHRRKEQP